MVSSAAGAALARAPRPSSCSPASWPCCTTSAGLLAAARAGAELTIVCLNNGGGGIFDFLPVAEHADPELYERHIATPADVDLRKLAELAGLPHTLVNSPEELRSALAAPGLVEARTDRARNVTLHRELVQRVMQGFSGR